MQRKAAGAILLITWMSLTSCHPRGIIELSRPDTQRCYQMLARDGELLTAVTLTLDEYIANRPANQTNVADLRTQCGDHLAEWDRLVKELFEKHGVAEEDYRLDVFRGRFMPKTKKSEE